MPEFIPVVIMWTFAAAFVLCMIGGLLTMFEIWEPKDAGTSKWLKKGVVISAVGAVVGFGIRAFNEPSPAPNQTDPSPKIEQPAPARPQLREPRPPAPREPQQDPEPDDPPASPMADIPDEVREWAQQALGPRPLFSSSEAENYPACVAKLGELEMAGVGHADAQTCKRAIQQFHTDVIVAFYNLKRPYDINLQAQEAELRAKVVVPSELQKYVYVNAERDRLNGSNSLEQEALHSLEEKVLRDIRRCDRSRCHR